MCSFFRVKLLLAAPVFWSLCLPAQTPEPEVFSPLGKSFFAKPDETRAVEKADLALAKGPATPELLLAAAQQRDAILRFSQSIPLYTRGMDEYPADVRFPRLRGHRFISTRKYDFAVADLKRAASIAPASFDVSYHLALAYYLRGDYNHAAREYQRCLDMAAQPRPESVRGLPEGWRSCHALDDDSRVAITDWAWRANRRAGKNSEAAKLLASIHEGMKVSQNESYYRILLLYKNGNATGNKAAAPRDGNAGPTIGYAVGLWHWLEGRKDEACSIWNRVVTDSNWVAFGFMAAEGELARGACRPVRKR